MSILLALLIYPFHWWHLHQFKEKYPGPIYLIHHVSCEPIGFYCDCVELGKENEGFDGEFGCSWESK